MTIDVQNLIKRYDAHFALHVPSLRIEAGEALGLVGNNGAGKTTFLRLLLDLIRADEGCVLIGGYRVDVDADWKPYTGSYLDESFLLDFLRPDEFFHFVGQAYGLSGTAIESKIAQFQVFLPEEAFVAQPPYIRDLSLGNRKKVGLVAALMIEPRLLILDEPFANLDPGSQIRLKNMLREMRHKQSTTMLISSHDLGHVTDVCGRIAVLDNGQIARDMRTSEATLPELEAYFATMD